MRSDTLMGTTRLGLVRPGGGEGESLFGSWDGEKEGYIKKGLFKCHSLSFNQSEVNDTENNPNSGVTCGIVSPFSVILFDSGGLSIELQ